MEWTKAPSFSRPFSQESRRQRRRWQPGPAQHATLWAAVDAFCGGFPQWESPTPGPRALGNQARAQYDEAAGPGIRTAARSTSPSPPPPPPPPRQPPWPSSSSWCGPPSRRPCAGRPGPCLHGADQGCQFPSVLRAAYGAGCWVGVNCDWAGTGSVVTGVCATCGRCGGATGFVGKLVCEHITRDYQVCTHGETGLAAETMRRIATELSSTPLECSHQCR